MDFLPAVAVNSAFLWVGACIAFMGVDPATLPSRGWAGEAGPGKLSPCLDPKNWALAPDVTAALRNGPRSGCSG
jgi:hypothetical protein